MPSYCIICEFKWQKDANTSFHKFTFDREDILSKWTEFVRKCKNQPNWNPSRWSSLCNKHFLPTDFKVQKGVLRKHLKLNAVPTIETPSPTAIESEIAPPPPLIESTLSDVLITNAAPGLLLDPSTTGTQCRLCAEVICLARGGGLNIYNCPNLEEWTAKYLRHLNILPDDFLTKSVCSLCYHQLEQFDRFSEMAIQSQNTLCAAFAGTSCSSAMDNNPLLLLRSSIDSSRVIKIKQEPIVNIKEENHILLAPGPPPTSISEQSEEFTNLSSLLSDFCHYGLGSGHIMEITDLTNDFINLTEDDNGEERHEGEAGENMEHLEVNIKPNIMSLRHQNPLPAGVHLKREGGGVIEDFCDEDDLSKAMISNEHSYCKFNNLLDGNILRLIKTEKKEEQHQQQQQHQLTNPGSSCSPPIQLPPAPLVSVPKIYIIDNALIKHNCDRCGDQFETRTTLIEHQKSVHDRFLCGHCNTRFFKFSELYFHKLNVCVYYRRGSATRNRRSYSQCKYCRTVFKLQSGYRNHLMKRRRMCKKLLNLRRARKQRKREEKQLKEKEKQQLEKSALKQFTCEICNKTFVRVSNLTQHKLSHSGVRQFACELCDKVFKRACGLSSHHKSFHLKLRPFACGVCHRGFALKADMQRCKHKSSVGSAAAASDQKRQK